MSETDNDTFARAIGKAAKKAKRKTKKRKAAKAAKVVKTVKRATASQARAGVKRAKASSDSAVEKPFLSAIRRKEREIRKIKDMMGKAKDLAG